MHWKATARRVVAFFMAVNTDWFSIPVPLPVRRVEQRLSLAGRRGLGVRADDLLDRLDTASMIEQRRLTVPFVKTVLADMTAATPAS